MTKATVLASLPGLLLLSVACNGTTVGDGPGDTGDLDGEWFDAGEGGAGGSAESRYSLEDSEAWLAKRGTKCQSSTAEPTPPPSPVACQFTDLSLPGVFEYSFAQGPDVALDSVRYPDGTVFRIPYLGCDHAGKACTGRLAYEWTVEYLHENEWYVTLTPILENGCKYHHVAVTDAWGGVGPRSVVTWAKFEGIIHTQPTPEGLAVGAVRDANDDVIVGESLWHDFPAEFAVTKSYEAAEAEAELKDRFRLAMQAHLESLTWACSWPE